MKILKTGTMPNKWVGICAYCRAIVEYQAPEDFGGVDNPPITIKKDCPYCNSERSVISFREDINNAQSIYSTLAI